MEGLTERILPQNIEAEAAILGVLLRDSDSISRVAALKPEHFYSAAHRLTYEAILAVHETNGVVDLILLHDEMERRGTLERCGGASFISRLTDGASPAHLEYYTKSVRERAYMRNLVGACSEVIDNVCESGSPGSDVRDWAEARLLEAFQKWSIDGRDGVMAAVSVAHDRDRVIEELKRRRETDGFPGFATFIDPLDDAIGGLLPGEFGLIAGGTGQGKSLSLLDIAARNWELGGRNIAYVSIELGIVQQEFRLVSWGTEIEIDKFRWGNLTEAEAELVESFFRDRAERPNHFYLIDVPENVNATFIDRKLAEAERKLGVRFELIFVDYLGLMTPTTGKFRTRTDWDALAEVSWNLHNLARRREVGLWSAVQKRENISEAERRRGGIGSIGLSYLIAQPTDITIVLTEKTLEGFLEANIPKGRDTGSARIKLKPDLRRARIHSER